MFGSFDLTPETKAEIVTLIRARLGLRKDEYSDNELNDVIDEVVVLVKRQFGF